MIVHDEAGERSGESSRSPHEEQGVAPFLGGSSSFDAPDDSGFGDEGSDDETSDETADEQEGPLQRVIELVVPKGERPERVDQYLARMVAHSSRTKVQEAISAGAITLNEKVLDRASYKVRGGDIFRITIPRPPRMRAEAEDIPLDIVFEDSAIIIINKPPGMVVHPAHGSRTGTLVNALLHHIREFSRKNAGSHLSSPGGDPDRPGIVHRLDKDTSGLMVVAKTEDAHRNLARQFFTHTAHRVYNAIVWGNFQAGGDYSRDLSAAHGASVASQAMGPIDGSFRGIARQPFGRIETLIGRHAKDRKRFTVYEADASRDVQPGKLAITDYFVIEEFLGFAFVELRLKTGRTHQIRVHMQHVGHPVFGDVTYGGRALNVMRQDVPHFKSWVDNLLLGMKRQALHARALRLHHPTTGELMEWTVPLPDDMQNTLLAMSTMTLRIVGK